MANINSSEAEEILQFMAPNAFGNVKGIAMEYFLGITGSEEGLVFIATNEKYLSAIVGLSTDTAEPVAKLAFLALINLTSKENISHQLTVLSSHPNFVYDLLKYVLQPNSAHADIVCSILSNISRTTLGAQRIVNAIAENSEEVGFDKVIQVFCRENFNDKNNLHYLGPFLSNLTQISQARRYILDKKKCVIQRLIPFTNYTESLIRRGGIIAALKNCCFETDYHSWLLSDNVDILPRLLLPLAGPEEFDDEDNGKLPEDLQYLEPEKTREEDPDIRKMLVEAINKLCSLKECRQYIKEKNAYVILRELHRWEKDPTVMNSLDALISLLIGDEPEHGMENLNQVEIPTDIEEKLQKTHESLEKESQQEREEMEKVEADK